MARQSQERHWVRSYGPMVVFCCLTIAGSVFIWISKSVGWNTNYAAAIPVGLMLLYFGLAYVADGLRLHDEQTGDNLYYMGFLFTLTSLGASLYQYTSANSIEEVVRNFGIAITSTIAGIALRVFYNQVRRDPLDVERTARHELANSARRIRAEMDAASQEFSVYRRTSNQMLQEGFEEIARQAQSTGQQIKTTLESLGHEAVGPLQTASATINKVIEANSKAFDQLLNDHNNHFKASTGALNSASEGIVGSMAELNKQLAAASKKLRNIKTPEEIVRIEIEPILEKVAEVAISHIDELNKLSEQQRNEFAAVLAEISAYNQLLPKFDRMLGLLERSVIALESQSQGRGQPYFQNRIPTESTQPHRGEPHWTGDRRPPPNPKPEPIPDTRRSIWPWQR